MAFKNVTVSEDYFQGHFPGTPLMPAVLMIEALTQVAAALILDHVDASQAARVFLRGVNAAKFRRNVFPGDRLHLEVTLGHTAWSDPGSAGRDRIERVVAGLARCGCKRAPARP